MALILLSLVQGMDGAHARLLLSMEQEADEQRIIEGIVATHAAYMDAIERVLGAPPRSFSRLDVNAVSAWVTAMTEETSR